MIATRPTPRTGAVRGALQLEHPSPAFAMLTRPRLGKERCWSLVLVVERRRGRNISWEACDRRRADKFRWSRRIVERRAERKASRETRGRHGADEVGAKRI